MKLPIIRLRVLWFAISGFLLIGSIVSLAVFGLRLGIDFTGGSLIELQSSTPHPVEEMRATLEKAGYEGVSVQSSGENGALVRLPLLTEQQHQDFLKVVKDQYPDMSEQQFTAIGPSVGSELLRSAMVAIVVVLVLIVVYVSWAFRKVTHPVASWKYGALTLVAAFHDVLIPLGIFSLLGHFYGWEVGTTFVAGVLTILGYSVNDTIVIFDRTRENLLKKHHSNDTFEETVELSLNQTLRRSLYTSVATLLTLFAILFVGGTTTKSLALSLIIGIVVGTYSSIFVASPLLVMWQGLNERKGKGGGKKK